MKTCLENVHKILKNKKFCVHICVLYLEVIIINNDNIIKGKVDATLNEALRKILKALNMTQQDFMDKAVKDFVINNLSVIMNKGSQDKQ